MASPRFSKQEMRKVNVILVFAVSGLALLASLTSTGVVDVDQRAYVQTLESMQDGDGYYPAMRDALVAKEGAPPTQVRSFRTPIVFWILSLLPQSLWRPAAGLAFAITIALAAKLAKPFGLYAPLAATAGVGLMAISYSSHLYLHAEIWAMPWILAGLWALRQGRATSPWLLAVGLGLRELFALLFLFAMILDWVRNSSNRRHWIAAAMSVSAFGLVHAYRASAFVAASGYEAPFGNEKANLRFVLSAISPGDGLFSWAVGIVLVLLGVVGLTRVLKTDSIAPVVAGHVIVMLPITLILGRVYWGFTFVPLLAIYAPGALGLTRKRPSADVQQTQPAELPEPAGL